MPPRAINILHVEDEDSQRRLFAHHLRTLNEFQFEIVYADSEEIALEIFRSAPINFVILDYNLRQGIGLHCLQLIREHDPIVPIIAISGAASDEIAADLVQAGADDYISKRDLTSGLLADRMRDALKRADTWRERHINHQN